MSNTNVKEDWAKYAVALGSVFVAGGIVTIAGARGTPMTMRRALAAFVLKPTYLASLSAVGIGLTAFHTSYRHHHLLTITQCDADGINIATNAAKSRYTAATYPANKPIEDRNVYGNVGSWSTAGVFDGHGGWQVSEYVCKNIMNMVVENIIDIDPVDEISIHKQVEKAFSDIEKQIVARSKPSFQMGFGEVAKVGSCVLLAFKSKDRLIVANCGDCRAILGSSISGTSRYAGTRITRDHNARVAYEQLMLEKNHPNESNLVVCKNPHACYVKGRLQLTRSLGDLYLKYPEFNGPANNRSGGRHIPEPYTPPYVGTLPDLHFLQLDKNGKDKFVILATDGVWDYLTDQQAVDIVGSCFGDADKEGKAAQLIVERALEIAAKESGMSIEQLKALPLGSRRRNHHDDTTAVVMYF